MPSLPGVKPRVFTKDGLSNKQDSVLMEIPGMGHIWNTSMPMGIIDKKRKERKPKFFRSWQQNF